MCILLTMTREVMRALVITQKQDYSKVIALYEILKNYARVSGAIGNGDIFVDIQTIEKLRELKSPKLLKQELKVDQESAIKLFEALKKDL